MPSAARSHIGKRLTARAGIEVQRAAMRMAATAARCITAPAGCRAARRDDQCHARCHQRRRRAVQDVDETAVGWPSRIVSQETRIHDRVDRVHHDPTSRPARATRQQPLHGPRSAGACAISAYTSSLLAPPGRGPPARDRA
jgi:hypothetical protein